MGHSAGEVCCGYADDALTLEQAIQVAYYRGMAAPAAGITGVCGGGGTHQGLGQGGAEGVGLGALGGGAWGVNGQGQDRG